MRISVRHWTAYDRNIFEIAGSASCVLESEKHLDFRVFRANGLTGQQAQPKSCEHFNEVYNLDVGR